MDTFATRKKADIDKLRQLASRMPMTLQIREIRGDPPSQVSCRINIPTPRDDKFPAVKQEYTDLDIQFPDRYPLQPPAVIITTPVWNPNIYSNGKWCFGTWVITENLELFIIRLMKVLALDPTIVNPKSPANGTASDWYKRILSSHPHLFPTVSIANLFNEPEKPKIVWHNK